MCHSFSQITNTWQLQRIFLSYNFWNFKFGFSMSRPVFYWNIMLLLNWSSTLRCQRCQNKRWQLFKTSYLQIKSRDLKKKELLYKIRFITALYALYLLNMKLINTIAVRGLLQIYIMGWIRPTSLQQLFSKTMTWCS